MGNAESGEGEALHGTMIRNIPGTDTAVTDARFESGLVEAILRLWTEADSGAVCVGSNPTGGTTGDTNSNVASKCSNFGAPR